MTIGEKIKSKRQAVGLSRAEFAKRIGCSYSVVTQWEKGQRKPSYCHRVAINEILDIGLMEFIKEVEI